LVRARNFFTEMSENENSGLWSIVFMYINYYHKQIERIIAAFHYYMIIEKKFKVADQNEVRNA
jgi:5-hydroxyisourate hydrolase-like protein (transthyretin family)